MLTGHEHATIREEKNVGMRWINLYEFSSLRMSTHRTHAVISCVVYNMIFSNKYLFYFLNSLVQKDIPNPIRMLFWERVNLITCPDLITTFPNS